MTDETPTPAPTHCPCGDCSFIRATAIGVCSALTVGVVILVVIAIGVGIVGIGKVILG